MEYTFDIDGPRSTSSSSIPWILPSGSLFTEVFKYAVIAVFLLHSLDCSFSNFNFSRIHFFQGEYFAKTTSYLFDSIQMNTHAKFPALIAGFASLVFYDRNVDSPVQIFKNSIPHRPHRKFVGRDHSNENVHRSKQDYGRFSCVYKVQDARLCLPSIDQQLQNHSSIQQRFWCGKGTYPLTCICWTHFLKR
jgi:hypothetical protein